MYTIQQSTPKKIATYKDLFNIPDHHIGEIINGRLSVMPRPAFRHTRTASVLGNKIGSFFDNKLGGWWTLDEPELHLTKKNKKDILVPDLAGWKREKLPKLPTTANTDIVPDWICEILSPSTGKKDRADKMPIYANYGVKYLWLIDPEIKVLEAYELKKGKWVLLSVIAEDAQASIVPFNAIVFPLDSLWI